MNRVVIIGGGASGLTAAIWAAREGAAVTVLEQNGKPAKKILATGNGKAKRWAINSALRSSTGTAFHIFPPKDFLFSKSNATLPPVY